MSNCSYDIKLPSLDLPLPSFSLPALPSFDLPELPNISIPDIGLGVELTITQGGAPFAKQTTGDAPRIGVTIDLPPLSLPLPSFSLPALPSFELPELPSFNISLDIEIVIDIKLPSLDLPLPSFSLPALPSFELPELPSLPPPCPLDDLFES